jgi:hypothetical protein
MSNYEILGVSPNADKVAIKRAYRKMCLIYHPDVGGDEKQFLRIKTAYEALTEFNPNISHNIHIDDRADYVDCVHSYYNRNGAIEHHMLFGDMLLARIVHNGNIMHIWSLMGVHSAILIIPKSNLLNLKYEYVIQFVSMRGTTVNYHFKFADPRSKWAKFWDKIF